MLVASVNRRWAVSSLPRSQVRDLYSSFGSFFACLCGYYRAGILACHLGPHHVTRLTLDQGRDVGVVRPGNRPPNGQAPLDLQPPPVADGLRRHPSYTPVYRHSDQPAWSDASSASIEDGEAALS